MPRPAQRLQLALSIDKVVHTDCVCSGAHCAAVGGFAALRMRRPLYGERAPCEGPFNRARALVHRGTPLTCHSEERSDVGISCRQLRFRRWLSCDPAGYCEIATGAKRPRNDKSGSIAPLNSCHQYCQPAWRSLSAATDAIGAYHFIGSHYESAASRRERHAAPLQHYIALQKGRTCSPALLYLLFHFHSAEDIDGAHAHAEVPALGIGVKIQVDLIALDAAADVLGHAVAIDILAVV